MNNLGLIFYLILFYICIGCFLYNFSTFTFQEKIVMFTLISGIQCIAGLTRGNSEV
jgi:hypothetical protein